LSDLLIIEKPRNKMQPAFYLNRDHDEEELKWVVVGRTTISFKNRKPGVKQN